METENAYNKGEWMKCNEEWERMRKRGKVAGGIVLVVAGIMVLLKKMGVELPHFLFTWPMILIAVGFVSMVKHGAKRFFWIMPTIIGVAFIISNEYHEFRIHDFIWPVVIILVGIFVIFKPRRRWDDRHWKMHKHHWKRHAGYWKDEWVNKSYEADGSEYIDSNNVFGGFKKKIISKNFKGGEINNFFGGGELDLSQADIQGRVPLEVNSVFGGMRLIIPAHWDIQPEMNTFCGGVDDKRYTDASGAEGMEKVLILKGSAVFGGIEIISVNR